MSCARGCCSSPREHYRSLVVGRSQPTVMSNGYPLNQDGSDGRDMDAYKRLKANGLQPPKWRGSAELEKHATTAVEIERGKVFEPKFAKKLQAATDEI